MERLKFFLDIDPNYLLIGMFVIFYTLEQVLNTQFKFSGRSHHLFHNALFFLVFIIGNIFWAIVLVFSIGWLNDHHIGLLYLFQLPIWAKLIIGIAMYDMITYWFHRIAHITPLLWRFHRVHHSDTSMDSSSNFRSHPIELFLWFGTSNIIAAGIFGLDILSLSIYYLIATPFFILEHSNLRFPTWLDKTLGWVITTPNLHKIHHEQDQQYTDSNFADIFIIWDRIFGTYKYKPVEHLKFGLKEFDEPKKQTFWYLIRSPFIKIERTISK